MKPFGVTKGKKKATHFCVAFELFLREENNTIVLLLQL